MNLNQSGISRIAPALVALAMWSGGTIARADSVGTGGTIVGVFSNPVLIGNLLNNPTVGVTTYEDDTGTAVYCFYAGPCSGSTGGTSGSTLSWGVPPDGSTVPVNQSFSQLTFTGAVVPSIPGGPYQVGTISYINGTSENGSEIFGATLSFYLNSTSGEFLGSDNVIISATVNQNSGLGLTLDQLQTDADYINICGPASDICGSSLEAFEDSEGGTGVAANLTGTIDGLVLNGISLVPGQDPNTSGSIGNLPALGSVPEPSAFILMVTAAAFGVALARRETLRRAFRR
jgi:hypothetical protein